MLMKVVFYYAMICFLSISLLAPNGAQAATTSKSSSTHIILDGKELSFEVAPLIEEGVMMVPMRATFEAFQAKVTWNEIRRMVTAVKGDKTIKLTTMTQTAYINDKPVQLSGRPFVRNGSTMVPIRFISEALGALVQWDDKTKTVTITSVEGQTAEAYPSTISDPNDLGMHNLMNGGGLAFHEDKVYFVGKTDEGERAIFKKNIVDEGEPTVLTSLTGVSRTYLQFSSEWLYFMDTDLDQANMPQQLYKMRVDGTEKTMVVEQSIQKFIVGKDWIYVLSVSSEGRSTLQKMSMDGGISEPLIQSQAEVDFSITDNLLVYQINDKSKQTFDVFSMSLNGTGTMQLVKAAYTPMPDFKIENGWLYYSQYKYPSQTLLRVKLDGSDNQVVLTNFGSRYNLIDNWVYYLNPNDRGNIYRSHLDGTFATKVTDTIGFIYVVPGYIFYDYAAVDRDNREIYYMMRSKLDGSDVQIVYQREYK